MKLVEEDVSDEGEIFSDDEEAAYYPKIVKSRDIIKKPSSGKSSDTKLTTEDESSGNSSSGPFDHEPGHKDYLSENQDPLEQDRSSRHTSEGSKYSPSSRDSRGRRRGRWTKEQGWSENSSHRTKSAGPHRQNRHESRSSGGQNIPARMMSSYQIACVAAIVKDRRDRGEALMVTPRGNACNNLDQFNYPAPPSWYLEALDAYEEKEKEKERKCAGECTASDVQRVPEAVATVMCPDRPEFLCIKPELKVDSEPKETLRVVEDPKVSQVAGDDTRSPKDVISSAGNGDESDDDYDRYLDQLDEEEEEIEDQAPDIGSVVTSLNEEFPQINPSPQQARTLSKMAGVYPEEQSLQLLLKQSTGGEYEGNGPVQSDVQPSKQGMV